MEKNITAKDIKKEMTALNYEPADMDKWNALTLEEQRQVLVKKRNEHEMNDAKKLLRAYLTTEDSAALPEDVKAAIVRIIGKTGGGKGRSAASGPSPFVKSLMALFPSIGTSVDELAIFKATKMGRGEFRKRVRETLKSADANSRMWIEFDESAEAWTLLAVGGKQPEGFKGKAIA